MHGDKSEAIITPPEVANTGPGVNRGSGGGARGCGFEERVGAHVLYYTPGSGEHGPRFLTGDPGAAPGGVASKNGWRHMRIQGGSISYGYFVCVRVCVCLTKWQFRSAG